MNNPFECSCPLRWLSGFLATHQSIMSGNPVCQTPANLHQIPIQDVIGSDFACPANEQQLLQLQQRCGLPLCPAGCECSPNGLVRCSGGQLQQPPAPLELTTSELYLDRNHISEIGDRLLSLFRLEKLDLSNNQLVVLTDHAFANLSRLHTLILSYNRIRCIELHAFSGLSRLRMLSLHSNDLSTIADGAFASLTQIKHVALGANPFYCDCRLGWLAAWLRRDYNEPGIARCTAPEEMADKLLLSTPPDQFVCIRPTPPEVLSKCDPCQAFPCKNGGFCRRPSISGSSSTTSQDATMSSDQALEEGSMFSDVFDTKEDLGALNTGSNPQSDSWKSWSVDGYQQDQMLDSGVVSTNLSSTTLRRRTVADALNFTCECAPGFYGNRCELKIDACFGAPCENGGQCRVLGEGRFECVCSPGFAGELCEQNVDDCVGNRCEHEAVCVDLVNDYRCQCNAHYTGQFCQNRIDYCSAGFNPCLNGAQCLPQTESLTNYNSSSNSTLTVGYTCECETGFTGHHCEHNVDDCARHLCQNGGRCIDGLNAYTCQCPEGFSGTFCELGGPQVELQQQPPQQNGCGPSDCVQGVCLPAVANSSKSDHRCACAAGYSGKRCDRLSSVSFYQGAYIEFPSPSEDWNLLNLSMILVTKAERGILLYACSEPTLLETEKDKAIQTHLDNKPKTTQPHLAAELYKGRLRISWMLGAHPISTMFSYELLNDGQPHRLQIQLSGRRLALSVDSAPPRWISSDGTVGHLQHVRRVWLGGIDALNVASAARSRHVWHQDSLNGCIQGLQFNGQQLDLRQSRRQQRVTPGCAQLERAQFVWNRRQSMSRRQSGHSPNVSPWLMDGPGEDPTMMTGSSSERWVEPNLIDSEDQITTKPKVTSTKKKTNIKNSLSDGCIKRLTNDLVRDGECVSVRRLKQTRCVSSNNGEGSCTQSGGCCQPVKSRYRTVKLYCDDGRTMVKRVSVPRRCSCTRNSNLSCSGSTSNPLL